jgi:hypothetical protein
MEAIEPQCSCAFEILVPPEPVSVRHLPAFRAPVTVAPVRSDSAIVPHDASVSLSSAESDSICCGEAARWLRRESVSRPLRRPRKHSDAHLGHGRERFWRFHAGEVVFAELAHSRSESEKFCFHAEESAQLHGNEICDDRPQFVIEAILCSAFNPRFYDIIVFDNGNAKSDSSTENSGSFYANDTAMDGKTFLTGL